MRHLQAGVLPRGAQGAGAGRGRAARTRPAARRRLHGKLTARPPTATACRGYRPSTGQLRWPLGPRRLCIPCSNLHRQGLLALERRARLMACASAGPRLDSCPVRQCASRALARGARAWLETGRLGPPVAPMPQRAASESPPGVYWAGGAARGRCAWSCRSHLAGCEPPQLDVSAGPQTATTRREDSPSPGRPLRPLGPR